MYSLLHTPFTRWAPSSFKWSYFTLINGGKKNWLSLRLFHPETSGVMFFFTEVTGAFGPILYPPNAVPPTEQRILQATMIP